MSWFKKTPSAHQRAKLRPYVTSPATDKFFNEAKKTAPKKNSPLEKNKPS